MRRRGIATLKDIAKLAGVSVCTVSRYLSSDIVIKKETEERICQAIKELGYVPNVVAKSLKRHETTNIAVILPKIDNLYYSAMTSGISEVLGRHHYNLFIYEVNNLDMDEHEVLRLMRENMAAGVIFIGLSYDMSFKDSIKTLLDWNIPVVYMNRQIPYDGYPLIYPDFSKAGRLAAEHLSHKGRRRTAFVYRNKSKEFIQSSVDAFMEGSPDSEYPILIDMSLDTAMDGCADILMEKDADSIFVMSELLAVQLAKFLIRRGIRIPEDIAEVGFGNSLMSEIATPGLTCLEFGDKEMGRKSAGLILDQIHKKEVEPVTVLPVRMVEREST